MSTIFGEVKRIRAALEGLGLEEAAGGKKLDLALLAASLLDCTSDSEHERVLIRYTRGSGTWSPDKRLITLRMWMFRMDGLPDGYHEGVWKTLADDPEERQRAILDVPSPPSEPLNQPVGDVPVPDPFAATKAHWTFGSGDRVYAVGPALTHLVPLKQGALFNFSVACSQIITNGTGLFEGVHGLKQSLGATRAGPDLIDPSRNVPFEATTIDTFRIVWPGGVPKGFDL